MSYTVERVTDRAIVESFMFHPDLWDRSSEDGSEQAIHDGYLTAPQCYFLLVKCESRPVGMMVCHEGLSKTVEIHIKVKPEDRKAHAVSVGDASLIWLMENTAFNKVITWVPEIYPAVRAFCKRKYGFIEEGCNRQSFNKGGKMVDMYLYGLTRKEIEVRLCQ